MDNDLKKGLVLLKSLIFHYHGMDNDEKEILEKFVKSIDAWDAYEWSSEFISSDYLSAFERSKEFLGKVFDQIPAEKRLEYLVDNWEDNHKKGYVTEMETTAMINLAKGWSIDKEFFKVINSD